MAMSILYLHKDFSKDAHHGKVFQISNLGPIFIRWRPRGSLRISRNHKRGGRARVPGPRPGPAPGPRPWPPLLWFLGVIRQPLGLHRTNMGPKFKLLVLFVVDLRSRIIKKTN